LVTVRSCSKTTANHYSNVQFVHTENWSPYEDAQKQLRIIIISQNNIYLAKYILNAVALIKKKRKFRLIYKEIQTGSAAKSYMRKIFFSFLSVRHENAAMRDGDKTAVYSCQSLSSTLFACLVNKTAKQNL